MRSCILLSYIGISAAICLAQEPDRLYADRANLASARRAAELWAAQLANHPADFDAAWKLARADYWLGEHARESERRAFLDGGIEAGRKAVAQQPNRPEGHFWIAANMGALAESFGIRAGLRYRKPVKDELEAVLRLDPAFMSGSADRVLGRWYYEVPGLFGGSNTKAEAHLRASLKYDDQSTISHYFLAEVLVDEGRKDEARGELHKVLGAPTDPDWAPEDADYKAKAAALLRTLGPGK
jgi:tetratricopeptide (TPR) repeat protein